MTCHYPQCPGGEGGTVCRPYCIISKGKEMHADIKRLHDEGCWSWGPRHYLCAYTKIKELERHPLAVEEIEVLWKRCNLPGPAPIGFVRDVEKAHRIK